MSTQTYHHILDHIQQLTPDELLQLQKELEILIQRQAQPKPYRVTEFKGMDKETWKDIDVQQYLEKERSAW
jgi:hypothetical protein